MKKVLTVLLLAALVGVPLAGCKPAVKGATATKPTEDMTYTVQLGYYGCDHMLAAAVARDAGIWKDLGINVNAVGGGSVPEAMAAGKMDVGYIGTEGLVRARDKGSPIFVAADNHVGGSYYISGATKYASAKDLVGKKFGVTPDSHLTDSYWVRLATAAGIPADTNKYEAVAIGGSDAMQAVKRGELDGWVDCDPWHSAGVVDGSTTILAAVAKLPTTGEWGDCCCYSMNDKFAAEHPELAKKMILAHSKAIELIYTDPVQAATIFAKEKGIPQEAALRTVWAKTVGDGRTLTWEVDPQRLTDEFDYVATVTSITVPPQADWVKTDLLDAAECDDFDAFIKEKVDTKFPLGMSFEDWKKAAGV